MLLWFLCVVSDKVGSIIPEKLREVRELAQDHRAGVQQQDETLSLCPQPLGLCAVPSCLPRDTGSALGFLGGWAALPYMLDLPPPCPSPSGSIVPSSPLPRHLPQRLLCLPVLYDQVVVL